MKLDLDYKKNEQFFKGNKKNIWNYMTYVAYAFYVAAAVALLWGSIGSHGFYINTIGALPFAIVGVIIHMIALSMTTSEKYLKTQVAKALDQINEEAREKLGFPEENPDLFFKMRGYDIEKEGTLVRKASDKFYSTDYAVTYFYIEESLLKVYHADFSVIKEAYSSEYLEFKFSDLSNSKLTMNEKQITTVDGKTHLARIYNFDIYSKDGNKVFSTVNREDSSDIDTLCTSVEYYSRKYSK